MFCRLLGGSIWGASALGGSTDGAWIASPLGAGAADAVFDVAPVVEDAPAVVF